MARGGLLVWALAWGVSCARATGAARMDGSARLSVSRWKGGRKSVSRWDSSRKSAGGKECKDGKILHADGLKSCSKP